MTKATQKSADPLQELEQTAKSINKTVEKNNRNAFKKYPLTFSFLSIVGFASVIYGIEHTLEKIPIAREYPWIVLIIGLVILITTGTIYKWFQNKEINTPR